MLTLARRIRSRLAKLRATRVPASRRRLADQFLRAEVGELVAGPPGSTWHHSAPTPDGRRLLANTSDPLREQKLWEACFDDDRDAFIGRRVLDVGAGDGFFSVAATLCGARSVHAVDLGPPANPNFPANLRWLSRVWGVSPAVTVGDLLSLPADGPKYDVILLFGVLEHLDDLFAGMRKVADLLAPGGRVYLETQMTRTVADALPVFELVSERFPSTVRRNRNETERVGLASGLMPNEAGLKALADRYGLTADPLPAGTPYEASHGGHGKRKVFVLTRQADRPLPKKG